MTARALQSAVSFEVTDMKFADATPIDGRGHRTRQTELLITERDQLLRMTADRFCAGMSDRAAAAMLHTKLREPDSAVRVKRANQPGVSQGVRRERAEAAR
jgi:hypothetical protein